MKILISILVPVVLFAAALALWSRYEAARIAERFPPAGIFSGNKGEATHYLRVPGETDAAPTVVFVHGASGNLLDQHGAFGLALAGKVDAIYLDRPGYGYSDRAGDDTPAKQADRYAKLLDDLGIERAVFVGHSLGAASVAAMGVLHPDRVAGLVFLAPATHPWPGGVTWYYDVASFPVIGPLFANTLVIPVGQRSLPAGVRGSFEPDEAPDNYVEDTAVPLILRPASFQDNADDVKGLNAFVKEFSSRYTEIDKPTIIVTGDQDDIVAPSIHSDGLKRDIEGSELIVLPGVGHKPDYAANDVAVDAIMRVVEASR